MGKSIVVYLFRFSVCVCYHAISCTCHMYAIVVHVYYHNISCTFNVIVTFHVTLLVSYRVRVLSLAYLFRTCSCLMWCPFLFLMYVMQFKLVCADTPAKFKDQQPHKTMLFALRLHSYVVMLQYSSVYYIMLHYMLLQ